jgi:quinoprotein glucose dehydrogenase
MNTRFVYWLIGILIFIAGLPFLGGSAIWYIGGADDLDVSGHPVAHGGSIVSPGEGWAFYGGDPGGHRFSNADQLTRDNVSNLVVAWQYSTSDLTNRPTDALERSAGESTPILVEDSLIFCSAFNEVIAVDPGTGEEKWRHDPGIDLEQRPANQFICRGVSYWKDSTTSGTCSSRIVSGTSDGTILALDASTGIRCPDFGDNGTVTIDPGMDLEWPGEFQITSPPVVVGDVVVVGSAISDNLRVEAPHGTVRAYDVRTGAQKWTFDPIPREPEAPNTPDWQGEFPPTEGHANAWAPMSADLERGLVFVPTSSPSPDFYGGLRPGDNRYANSVVALDVSSGDVEWAYQLVHHDVWDYDTPAQPGLYTIWKEGRAIDVVAQVTKMGLLFVLDRETGEPVIPVEERPVPGDGVPGETLSPTQPFPVRPPALVPDRADPEDAFGITWFDKRECANAIASLKNEGLYTPPTTEGTLFLPFTGGGANWGGSAYDASRNLLVVNMSNLAHLIQLIPSDKIQEVSEVLHSSEIAPQAGAPFGVRREILTSSLGLPCTPPPWGLLMAVDIEKGELVWRRTLGTTEDLAGGLALKLGTPTLGGPIITESGLIFIGSTVDYYLRAFDLETGNELWKGRLPTTGIATPMTYTWEGKQYIVIFAGGYGSIGTPIGDTVTAFALP